MDRQVARLLALKKAAGVNAGLTIRFRRAVSIAHETAGNDKVPCCVDRGNCKARGQRGELFGVTDEQCIGVDQKRVSPQAA